MTSEQSRPVCIVLNYDSAAETISCVQSIRAYSEIPIVVVDNGSKDPGEVETLKKGLSDVLVLETGANLGYAGGMNVGMAWAADSNYNSAFLLNPDIVPAPGIFEAMLMRIDRNAVVGVNQVTQSTGTPYVTAAILNGPKPTPFDCSGCAIGHHKVDIVSGACLLVSLDVFVSHGGLDERFFHYKEEFDYCFRLGRAGKSVELICSHTLQHQRGGSLSGASPLARYYAKRNEILFVRMRFGWRYYLRMPGLFAVGARGHRRAFRSEMWGIADGLTGQSGQCTRRLRAK